MIIKDELENIINYYINEIIMKMHFHKEGDEFLLTLGEIEKNVFEIILHYDDRWDSTKYKTLEEAVEAIKMLLTK